MLNFNLPEFLRGVSKKEGSEECVGSEQSQEVVSSLFCKTVVQQESMFEQQSINLLPM